MTTPWVDIRGEAKISQNFKINKSSKKHNCFLVHNNEL